MNRTLEEILNTPVEFKEGQRVFSLYDFKLKKVNKLDLNVGYPIELLNDNGAKTIDRYMIEGKLFIGNTWRHLLTEEEAYELFPSLKPKVYEYQVVYRCHGTFDFSREFCVTEEEFKEIYKNDGCVFVELYEPSKRERKS